MLSERHSQLLTAYLDGELSARQRKAVVRLLHRSPEARALLRQLQQDAQALRQLPARKLPADFPLKVVRTIAERGLQPGGLRPSVRPRGIPAWAGLVAAAAVLLMVGAGAFVFLGGGLTPPDGVAIHLDRPTIKPLEPVPPMDPVLAQMAEGALHQFAKEPGVRVALANLANSAERTRLTNELREATAYHVDLEPGHAVRTVDRLAEAFRDSGIELVVDSAVRARMAKRQPDARYVVYAENLRPDELTAILHQFGGSAQRGDAPAGSALLNHMSPADRQHLARLLGMTVDKLQPARKLRPGEDLPITLREPPISLPKDPQPPKSKTDRPAPKEPARVAVVLAYHGGNPASEAVRRFRDARRPSPPPGTLQVYFVLHEARA
jgi:hypothetical protein